MTDSLTNSRPAEMAFLLSRLRLRRPLTSVWKEEVLEDLVQTLEGISKPEVLCFLHGQIRLA